MFQRERDINGEHLLDLVSIVKKNFEIPLLLYYGYCIFRDMQVQENLFGGIDVLKIKYNM